MERRFMMSTQNYCGKLVVVAHWADFKLEDATKLGILNRVTDRYCRPVSQKYLLSANAVVVPGDSRRDA